MTAMRAAFDLGITLIDRRPILRRYRGLVWRGISFSTPRSIPHHQISAPPLHQKRNLFANIEGSLKNLRTDYADLYVIFPDVNTRVDEILDGLIQVKESGKARARGRYQLG